MSSHLTPEPRVNKLGHTVTKHVKTQSRTVVIRNVMPSPSASPNSEIIGQIMKSMETAVAYMGRSEHMSPATALRTIQEKLEGFDLTTLGIVRNTLQWSESLPMPLNGSMYYLIRDNDEQDLRELMVFYPHVDRWLNVPREAASKLILGLHHLDHFKDTPHLEKLNGRNAEVAIAFINVTASLCQYADPDCITITDDEPTVMFAADKDLQALIVSHPEKASDMTSFIKERHSGDAVVLREFIENRTALKEGIL